MRAFPAPFGDKGSGLEALAAIVLPRRHHLDARGVRGSYLLTLLSWQRDDGLSVTRTIPVGPQLNHCAADVPRLSHRLSQDSERPMGSRRSGRRRSAERSERVAVLMATLHYFCFQGCCSEISTFSVNINRFPDLTLE